MRRRPARSISTIAILCVAFTTALMAFGLAHAILWRPLPFKDPDRLVLLWERIGTQGDQTSARVTGRKAVTWRTEAASLDGVAMFGSAGFRADSSEGSVPVWGLRVSGDFFDVLGVQPAIGRLLQPADQDAGAAPVVVVAHAYWVSRLGGRPDVVGTTLRLSDSPYTIVGVLPDIWLPAWPVNPAAVRLDPAYRQVFVPLAPDDVLAQNARSHLYGAIGRIRIGDSLESVNHELAALSGPSLPEPHGGFATSLRSALVQQSRDALLLVFGAAACVWLLACINLAALEVAGFEGRLHEFRTRAALGAGLGTLARQVAAESCPAVVVAGLAALGISRVAFEAIAQGFAARIPFMTRPGVDMAVGGVLALMGLLTWLLLSAWPIVRLRRMHRMSAGTSRVTAQGASTFRALVVSQVAGAVALLVVTGLLVHALLRIDARDPGFDDRSVHAVDVSLWGPRYHGNAGAIHDVTQRLEERLRASGWVAEVASAYDHPYEANWIDGLVVHGDVAGVVEDVRRTAQLRIVSADYPRALRLQIEEGRSFSVGLDLTDRGEVLVNESFVRMVGASVGRTVSLSAPRRSFQAAPQSFEIVGVVGDEHFRGIEQPSEPAVYVSTRQFPLTEFSLLVRVKDGQHARMQDLRSIASSIDGQVSLGVSRLLTDLGTDLQTERRLTTFVIAGFGLGALALAATGLYGLLTMLVANREREVGVRFALGATPGVILRQTVSLVVAPTVAGTLAGVALGVLGERAVGSLLVGVDGMTPVTVAAVMVLMAGTALVAGVLPARRAARIDPAVVLRR